MRKKLLNSPELNSYLAHHSYLSVFICFLEEPKWFYVLYHHEQKRRATKGRRCPLRESAVLTERPHSFCSLFSCRFGDLQGISLAKGRKGHSMKSIYNIYVLLKVKTNISLPGG